MIERTNAQSGIGLQKTMRGGKINLGVVYYFVFLKKIKIKFCNINLM
jgi:hypothetical protein